MGLAKLELRGKGSTAHSRLMSVVSLRKYLVGSEENQPHRRVVDLLLEGIVESAVRTEGAEYKGFADNMNQIVSSAPPGCSLADLLVMVGSATQALKDYNARTTSVVRQQGVELQHIVQMLTQTVITISGGSEKSVESLTEVRRGLESAARLDDVHRVKARLGECLRTVCEEAERQKLESGALVAQLQQQIDRSPTAKTEPAEDRVTGLPRRKAAEDAVRQALLIPRRKYLVTAVLHRLQTLNARFGQQVGDRILRAFGARIKENLLETDMLFRWDGPALVALLWREETLEQVRKTVKRTFDAPYEKEFDIGDRQVLVPISPAWSVIGLIPPATNSFNYIDRFVASQSPRDYC
jgi:diguanylate cyclase (GGDEF)-like protein